MFVLHGKITYIVVCDVRNIHSELPDPDREALHKKAALVAAHWSAGSAEERQENQEGQEERLRSHAGGRAAEVFWR